jgi:uncharacterized protein YkwD
VSLRQLVSTLLLALALTGAVTTTASAAVSKTKVTHKKKRKKVLATVATPAVCANTDLQPTADNLDEIRESLDCLHDQIRSQRGLGTLAENAALDEAAAEHTEDMLARNYFDHDSPEGGTFDQRILSAGYARKDQAWSLGENLLWADGDLATPAAMMNAWMNSEGHRENILNPRYRELGLAVRLGTPEGEGGVTVSAEFGVVR